jgi:hypothetical protein
MKIKMLTSVVYQSKKYAEGTEVDMPDDTALRWCRHKIATSLEPEKMIEKDVKKKKK